MKIAYLIQAHNNPLQLNRLITALDEGEVDFYIHIDKKSNAKFLIPTKPNIHLIKNRVNVFWGGFSQVQASINLLKNACLESKHDYYVFISGVDYPVKSNECIRSFFEKYKGNEFIDVYNMPLFDKSFDRLNYYFLEGSENKLLHFICLKLNVLLRMVPIKRKLPEEYSHMKCLAGSSWWALSNSCVQYILKYIQANKNFVEFFKHTLCADEMFFQMIIGSNIKKFKIMNSITYTDWSGFPRPAIIEQTHIPVLAKQYLHTEFGDKKQYLIFARKFTDASSVILDKVDVIKKKSVLF